MREWVTWIRRTLAARDLVAVRHLVLVLANGSCVPQLLLWGALFFAHGGLGVALLFVAYGLTSALFALILALRPDSFRPIAILSLFLLLLVNGVATVMLGGLVESGGQFLWGLVAPIGALIFFGGISALMWFAGWLSMVLAIHLLGHRLSVDPILNESMRGLHLLLNCVAVGFLGVETLRFLVTKMQQFTELLRLEEEKVDALLRNILPGTVVERLKAERGTIADSHPEATVMFLDLVGFTVFAGSQTADETVGLLHEIYGRFDDLTDAVGLEKIKTIGDCYMVVSGVPTSRVDHAPAAVELAVRLRAELDRIARRDGLPLSCRIGLHSGPLTSGVIGKRKFAFDVWGDTVNTASRMESHGLPGRIHLSDATRSLLGDGIPCVLRGEIFIKGKGPMRTWFVQTEDVCAAELAAPSESRDPDG
jgi:guanylate cyclase